MEWRCEWCGKPHEANDPPCDNCGHGKFEKAVVRQTDLAEEETEAALVWVCTDCGREHPKNNPPCSRCGNLDLEQQRQEIDESELSAPGYLDLLTPQYVAAATVALALAVVFILGATGIVDLPGFGGDGVPPVDDVPGNDTQAGTVSLSAVEERFTDSVNDDLDAESIESLTRDGDLDAVARHINQRYVRSAYSGGSGSPTGADIRQIELPESVRTTAGDVCGQDQPRYFAPVIVDGNSTASSAAGLAEQLSEQFLLQTSQSALGGNLVGVDAHHGPDGAVLLLVVTC